MREVILIIATLGEFAFGYVLLNRLGAVLEENDRKIQEEERSYPSPIRPAYHPIAKKPHCLFLFAPFSSRRTP